MRFHDFAQQLLSMEDTSSRLVMTEQLAQIFRALEPSEIAPASYLLQGQLLPNYESQEFGISIKTILKALSHLAGRDVTKEYKEVGDAGKMASMILEQHQVGEQTVSEVYHSLLFLAKETGEGSQDRKLQQLIQLLSSSDAVSGKLVIRMILGKLRLGFSTMTMLDSLSWAMCGAKTESSLLEDAYQRRADIGFIASRYLVVEDAVERQQVLATISLQVGTPVMPALCQRLNSATEIIDKMHTVIAEPKFDGLRLQIHIEKTDAGVHVKAFTRNLEDASHMFPELLVAAQQVQCRSCILDSEAISYDPATGQLRTFQETITRKRKHDIAETAAGMPIRCYVFDVLELDGRSLIAEKLRDRKDLLKNLFINNEVFYYTEYITTSDPKELREFHEQQLAEGLEGAVIKQQDSLYQSGRKGWSWVKIKEAEGTRGKLKDTLDCVVLGYYAGRGKRTQFGMGAFLVGVLADESSEQLKTIAKIGTGLSDEQFRELYQRCQPLISDTPPRNYDVPKAVVPDVWVQPGLVVEIAADELTQSPVHTAGVALRFPRLVKFRDDKNWQQATTVGELKSLQ